MLDLQKIYETAALCRAFEEECERRIQAKEITSPVYLSTGQEYIPATIAEWVRAHNIHPHIFIQHRAHSVYLSFGGDMDELIYEIIGDRRGCSSGMGGSNCIQSIQQNIYGHDALLGTQVPIAVGYCYATLEPTICFMGDAAAEEDYTLSSLGWAVTQDLPILFVVEDNNLSILTEVKARRSWSIYKVAGAFGLAVRDVYDDPEKLWDAIPPVLCWPALINVHTTRLRWHSGAGTDDPNLFDRHAEVRQRVQKITDSDYQELVRATWERCMSGDKP